MENQEINYNRLYQQLKSEASLEINYAKLTLTEKVAILVSTLAIALIILLIVASAFFIVAWAAVRSLEAALDSRWLATAIVIAVHALLLLIIWAFRKPLLINPVARFVSKLFLSHGNDK